jgi:hypothetical protein
VEDEMSYPQQPYQQPPTGSTEPWTQAWTEASTDASTDASRGAQSMKDGAVEAAQAGRHMAGEVTRNTADRAQEVKDEAVRQTRDLLGEARGQVSQQAGQQQDALVKRLRALSSELGAMAHHGAEPGVATELAEQARQRIAGVADWLEHREPGDVLQQLRGFARRRPGTFLVGALAAGVVAGRLTRGAVEAHTGDGAQSGLSAGAQADVQVDVQPPSPADQATEVLPTQQPPAYGAPTYQALP